MNFDLHDAWSRILSNPIFWVYCFGFIASAVFVYRYARYSDWRSTTAGRGVMQLAGSICAVMGYATIWRIFGVDWPYRILMGLILIGGVDLALLRLMFILVELQGGVKRIHRIKRNDNSHHAIPKDTPSHTFGE